MAEQFHASWFGPDQAYWSQRMRAELPNLRAALAYALGDGVQPHAGLALAGALYNFWCGCGSAREGRHWLERALAANTEPSPARAQALTAYAWLLVIQPNHAAATDTARECLDLAQQLDEPRHHVEALLTLGMSMVYRGDQAGFALLEEAVVRARRLGPNDPAVALAVQHLGVSTFMRGDPVGARELIGEAQRVCREHGEQWWRARSMLVGTILALTLDDPASAGVYARESLRIARTLDDQVSIGAALEFLGWIAAATADYRRAARLLGAAGRHWRAIGSSPIDADPWKQLHDIRAAAAREALGHGTYGRGVRRGARYTPCRAVNYALEATEPTPLIGTAIPPQPSGVLAPGDDRGA